MEALLELSFGVPSSSSSSVNSVMIVDDKSPMCTTWLNATISIEWPFTHLQAQVCQHCLKSHHLTSRDTKDSRLSHTVGLHVPGVAVRYPLAKVGGVEGEGSKHGGVVESRPDAGQAAGYDGQLLPDLPLQHTVQRLRSHLTPVIIQF